MTEVVLVIHSLIALALIGVVLLQRSEGGALGIGGGGGGGGSFFSSRGAGNVLSRATALLAVAFFVTSFSLTIMSRGTSSPGSIFDSQHTGDGSGTPDGGSLLPDLPGAISPPDQSSDQPSVPTQ